MNNIIPFKKNIIFKTVISEITDISLSHDYKILDDMIEGEFYLSGTYKMTEASLVNEEFYYNIPFNIALSDRVNKDTINLKLDSFDYKINGDTLSLNINLDLEAEEVEEDSERGIIDEIKEKIEDKLSMIDEEEKEDSKVEISEESEDLDDNTMDELLTTVNKNQSYITYKVHIFRNGDSIETISDKYNVSIEDIKEYNDINNINVGDKILVPYIYNE